jgi:peptide/nickel transport system permease protein
MIRDAQAVLVTRGWASVLPGACIVLVVLALSILGDEMRTVLTPSRG